jgi:hypothetical protein
VIIGYLSTSANQYEGEDEVRSTDHEEEAPGPECGEKRGDCSGDAMAFLRRHRDGGGHHKSDHKSGRPVVIQHDDQDCAGSRQRERGALLPLA